MNFRKSIILSSLVATAVLFGGCGGDDNKTPTVQEPTGTKPVFVSPDTYNVVAGQRKAITLTVGENIINPEGNKFKFEFVDKTEAPSTLIDANTGVIKYTAPADGSAKSIIVKVTRILEGNTVSEPFTITFSSISQGSTTTIKPYKTGADEDAGTGNIERTFLRNSSINYNIQDPSGLQWADSSGEKAKLADLTYSKAEDYCKEELVGDWRVPNKDELMNLIDYSKSGRASMINELFEIDLVNTWATPEFGKNIYVGQNNGMIWYSNNSTLAVRCVMGTEASREHLIHSDLLGYTYDENTKLEWSPASAETMTATEGASYCAALASSHDDPHTDFRLPSINEYRSVVENGTVSDFITKGNRQLISSTPYVDENGTKIVDNTWRLVLKEDGTVAIGAGSDANRISCVKDMD